MAPSDPPKDAKAEVDELRDRVAALSTPVEPIVASATAKAQDFAQQAKQRVTQQTDGVAQWARAAPATSLLLACGVGYVVGRIVR